MITRDIKADKRSSYQKQRLSV